MNITSIIQWGLTHAKQLLVGLLAAGLLALGGWAWTNWRDLVHERDAYAASLRVALRAADSLDAVADSTRQVALLVTRDRDSLAVYARRAVQALALHGDSLDAALNLERRANASLLLTIRSLERAVAEGTSRVNGDSLTASFHLRQPPYTVDAEAMLVPPPRASRLTATVALDSLLLGVRVGCGAPGLAGYRPATTRVTAPQWARVGITSVEQDEGVCNATLSVGREPPRRLPWWSVFLLGAGTGALAAGVF